MFFCNQCSCCREDTDAIQEAGLLPIICNQIPLHIRSIDSVSAFIKALTTHLFAN